MGMNDTPRGERLHIALFGRRNAGKSSIINALTNQNIAIVSEQKGTTTDPVYKAMELLPLGPVVLIDTPGMDDGGDLGKLRVLKAKEVLGKADIALIVTQAGEDFSDFEVSLLDEVKKRNLPAVILLNKADLFEGDIRKWEKQIADLYAVPAFGVSAVRGDGIEEVKRWLGKYEPSADGRRIVADLIEPHDFVVLVVPIDKAAPKGRLILPQQQTIRDVLEAGAVSVAVKETELSDALKSLGKKPKLVITDSQAFSKVAKDTPDDILLTSFSILFARYKGELEMLVKGAKAVDSLKDGDVVLMAEGCTHHRQCDDIGTVKLPKWILEHTGKKVIFETASGAGFPNDLSKYAMVVHCGACTLNQKEMKSRLDATREQGVPIVNYGILIAYLKGVLKRSLAPFPGIFELLER